MEGSFGSAGEVRVAAVRPPSLHRSSPPGHPTSNMQAPVWPAGPAWAPPAPVHASAHAPRAPAGVAAPAAAWAGGACGSTGASTGRSRTRREPFIDRRSTNSPSTKSFCEGRKGEEVGEGGVGQGSQGRPCHRGLPKRRLWGDQGPLHQEEFTPGHTGAPDPHAHACSNAGRPKACALTGPAKAKE